MGGPMIKAFVQLGLAGLIFVAATVAAEAETIVCPLTQATRTSTNAPGGAWWTTPIVNSLTNTQIVNIGGQQALQCVYGGAGAIQRYAPAGTVCVAIAGGFQCNPIVPVTHSTGTADVLPSFQLDLDNGAIAVAGTDADLWLQIVNFFEVYLTPVNGAQFGIGDLSNRGFVGCLSETMSSVPVPIAAVPVGSYICVRTGEGRISQFRINGFAPFLRVLSVGYTTWQ